MPAKTPARPARKPVGQKVVRISKSAKSSSAKSSSTKSETAKPARPNSKAVSLVTQGRHVPAKLIGSELPRMPMTIMLARISSAIEDELTQIEAIVSGGVKLRDRAQAERRARTLASLARTLREVMQLRAGEEKTKRDDDAVPRDISELRRELARRLDRIVADAKAAHPGESG
jgi:hypothetical protein